MKLLQKNIIKINGTGKDSPLQLDIAGNEVGKFVVAYHVEDGSPRGELGWNLVNTATLQSLKTDKLAMPYYQGYPRLIDTGNSTFIAYDSTPRNYHAVQYGFFVDSNGSSSTISTLTNGQANVADWEVDVSRFTDGKYVVTISSERMGAFDIYAEMLDTTGTQVTTGLFRINNFTSGRQQESVNTVLQDHKVLIAWRNLDSSSAINAAIVDLDKQKNVSGDQAISTAAPGQAKPLAIAVDSTSQYGQILYSESGDIWSRSFSISGDNLLIGSTTNLTKDLHWSSDVKFSAASALVLPNMQLEIAVAGKSASQQKVFEFSANLKNGSLISTPDTVYTGAVDSTDFPNVSLANADGTPVLAWTSSEGLGVAKFTSETINTVPTGSIQLLSSYSSPAPIPATSQTDFIQGKTLYADGSKITDADGLGTFGYQWQRSTDGNNWSDITGATQNSYGLAVADVGGYVRAAVRYTDGGGTAETVYSASSLKITGLNSAPGGNIVITGTAQQGQVLAVDTGSLTDADGLGSFSYQWAANGVNLAGATGSSYLLTEAEVGKTLTVTARYTDGHGTTETVTSAASNGVANVNDAPLGTVSLNGTATQGQMLSVSQNLSDADGLGTLAYQWLASGTVIAGANGSSYRLTEAEVGKLVAVTVNYTDGHGTAESVSSQPSLVNNLNDLPGGRLTVSGRLETGQTVSVSHNLTDADGLGTLSYQWLANGTAIDGATGSSYVLTRNEIGKNLSVMARYTDGHGTAENVISDVSGPVVSINNPVSGTLTLSGIAAQNQTLSVQSSLTDADGLGSLSYQWLANGNVIAGAISDSYRLTEAEVGKTISVTARYTDGLGTAESMSSALSGVVVNVNDAPGGAITLNGTPTQGQVLNVSQTLSDADGLGTLAYQWLANGVAIAGASGTSYRLTEAEVGKTISVMARYTDGHGQAEQMSSAATARVLNVNDAPGGEVSLSGTPQQGETLTVSQNLTDADGLGTLRYQWQADGVVLPKATGNSYLLSEAEVGKTVSVTVSYTDGQGSSESVTRAASAVVANVNDPVTGNVTIKGKTQQGEILTLSQNLADADGLGTLRYEWRAGDRVVGSGERYTLTGNEVGKTLTVTVGYTDGHGTAESLTSTATAPVMAAVTLLKGTAGNDKWLGKAGDDRFDGLAGHDTLSGFAGNDSLIGNTGNDSLDGGVGNDTLKGDAGNDVLLGGSGHDSLDGGADNDKLDGGAGNDTLQGGLGIDTLNGGEGNDVYVVDNFRDEVIEIAGSLGGNDTVQSSRNYTLPANVENLVLTGLQNLTATGNEGANRITGNSGDNQLDGLNGNDALLGGEGDDTLIGGGGVDTLVGGDGSDTYQVSSTEDVIQESARDGDQDVVESQVDYVLGDAIEVLTLLGQAQAGYGNELDNVLEGNGAANQLNGGAGHDELHGQAGDDSLEGGIGDDTLEGGEGNDVAVYSGEFGDYRISYDKDSQLWSVEDVNLSDGLDEGADTLGTLEIIGFADQDYSLLNSPLLG